MKTLMFLKALFLFVMVDGAYASGFQGLSWGASIESIKSKFPQAKQRPLSTDVYPICTNANGETYLCTLAQSGCLRTGVGCHPPLIVKKYPVGPYLYELSFDISKDKTLMQVALSLSEGLVGKTTSYGRQAFEFLLDRLEGKYGSPSVSEPYKVRRKFFQDTDAAFAFYQWRSEGTKINLILSTRFDPETQKYITEGGGPTIDVIYSPLVDDAASKL